MNVLSNITVKIVQRSFQGKPFSEIRYSWTERGRTRYAISRNWVLLQDNEHARANELQGFLRRREMRDRMEHFQSGETR